MKPALVSPADRSGQTEYGPCCFSSMAFEDTRLATLPVLSSRQMSEGSVMDNCSSPWSQTNQFPQGSDLTPYFSMYTQNCGFNIHMDQFLCLKQTFVSAAFQSMFCKVSDTAGPLESLRVTCFQGLE